ncbi:MAG: ATP-grasp domain-containing protein, partial [Methyloprofundus sp.]|nr:ATP-grasp domain-containing protein [Methyloprofundus sp.]
MGKGISGFMRILVFEFITGGGFATQAIPESLLQEGRLMRHALLADLGVLPEHKLLVLQDERLAIDRADLHYLMVSEAVELEVLLSAEQDNYDVVWLIAPETDGILAFWCHFFTAQGKLLANTGEMGVKICQDKFSCFELLQRADIASVPTQLLDKALNITCPSVLKLNNSVGCEGVYFLESEQHWKALLPQLKQEQRYSVQPYIAGKVLSLSCLFYQGDAYFICCNEQIMQLEQQQFELLSCVVNVQLEKSFFYQQLCQQIAEAIPDLFGYVGIDFIQTATGESLILEINPRLTSSYAGIEQALGLNVAALVLTMLNNQPPILMKTRNQQVIIMIKQG